MLWTCPACHLQIRHSDLEARPRLGAVYRCHVCRIELTLDPEAERLNVAPLDDEPPAKARREA